MMNGTRCEVCGKFVYARNIPRDVRPSDFVCQECSVEERSIDFDELESVHRSLGMVAPTRMED